MAKFLESKKSKIIALVLAVVIVAVGVGGYFIFRKRLKYDWEKSAVASKIVENAQYTPDMDKFLEANNSGLSLSNSEEEMIAVPMSSTSLEKASSMTKEEFASFVDEYGTVENYSGAGKYLGYDIYDIKNEIKFVVEEVPAFNQWFRMPSMREDEGYVNTPYYEDWAYYLELDGEKLSITRVCYPTRSSYIDIENKKVIEDNDDGTSFSQYEIMKTNYYIDTNGDEVVECYIYSVGVDHHKLGPTFNKNEKDYYSFEYQYLKNVRDKMLIKYHITSANRGILSVYGYTDQEGNPSTDGMDIRGLTPYGCRREFTIANYNGYTNVDLTKIDQKFPTIENPDNDSTVSFNVESNNIKMLVENIGLSNEKYENATNCMTLLDEISKQIIDNFELKNNWPTIYKESSNAFEIETIKGPHFGKELPISDVDLYATCGATSIDFYVSASAFDLSKIDLSMKYSLSIALRNRNTGKLYIVATNYNLFSKVYKANSDTAYYYVLNSDVTLNASSINIDQDGEYDVTCVLTVEEYGVNVIVFDTMEVAFLMNYSGFTIPNSVDKNGVEHSYKTNGRAKKLTITVSTVYNQ